MSWLAFFQKIHGLIGVLAVASCIHPVITLRATRPPNRRQRLSAILAAVITVAAVGLGWLIYGDYRLQVRQVLLDNYPLVHRIAFELKEAVGYFAGIAAACGGVLVARFGRDPLARRGARMAFGLAATGTILAMVLGIIVASFRDLH